MSKKLKYQIRAVGLFTATPALAILCGGITMATSWDGFLTSMKEFFETGLGGPGMQGIGIAIASIGIIAAIVSFVVHKFNPQSRMPGWVTCLMIGLVGTIAMTGIGQPLAILNQVRDTIMGWLGV